VTACIGGASGKSAPHMTRTTTKKSELLSSVVRHPAFVVLAGVVLTVLLLAVPALQLLALGFILGVAR
jgi:hypothetical protein